MVFSRIVGAISAASSLLYARQPSDVNQAQSTATFGFGFPNTASYKNNLRVSSSLQDLSSYRRLDIEDGDNGITVDTGMTGLINGFPSLNRESGGSSFSKEKPVQVVKPSVLRKWFRAFMLLLCFLSIAFLVYVIFMLIYSYWTQGSSRYYVVLDSGSTGTRVFVFEASVKYRKDSSLPIVVNSLTDGVQMKHKTQSGRAYDRMETEPGFHKLVHNASGLRYAIEPLVRWAEKQIPKNAYKSTSLFLLATAGVRKLPVDDRNWLLENAWSILSESPFMCKNEWVRVITGTEEAYYGWLALNHRTGILGSKPRKATFGALDLGGSSLQVTFESDQQVNKETSLNLKIGSVNHHLTAYSLSGYGLNDAFGKSVIYLYKKASKSGNADIANLELKHPCLNSGYKEQYFCSQCSSNYQEGGNPAISGPDLVQGSKPGALLQLVGAPNWEECSALAKIAVNLSEWSNHSQGFDCDVKPCALPEKFPQPYGQFYAISGFFVVYKFFNLSAEATLDDVLEKGREFCEKNWDIAKSSVAPQPFIEQYCFRAPYVTSLLREGLHITDNQITIGSGSVTWTLGVALIEAGQAYSSRFDVPSYDLLRMKINPFMLIPILCLSLFLLVCALSGVSHWMPRFLRRPYLPLFRHNGASSASVLNIPSPFRFQRWSPISSGDGRVKMPLSPTISGRQRPFDLGHGLGDSSSGIQLMESSLHPSTSSVSHSFSSHNLGQMQFDNSVMGSFWSPHRGHMRLQSRRSQSREDLNSSLAETHMVKV